LLICTEALFHKDYVHLATFVLNFQTAT